MRHQAIAWTIDDLLSTGPEGKKPLKFESKYELFF